MSRTKRCLFRWTGVMGLLGLLVLVLLLGGCGEPTAAPTEPPQATEVSAAEPTSAPTEPPPTNTPIPTEPPPTDTPTPEPIDDTGCITCHTSDETLQAMATEPEAPEVESEGEG